MATGGKEVYLRMYEAIRNLESDSRAHSTELSRRESDIRNMVAKREELFSALAQEYLPEMNKDSVRKTLKQVQYDVQKIFEEKERHRQKLEFEAANLLKEKVKLEDRYNGLTGQLNQLVDRRAVLEEKVGEKLKKDQKFASLCDEASVIGEQVKQNRLRAEEMKKEADEKLPDFKKDSLFSYLLESNYSTAKYKNRGLRKRLDRWVARRVDFSSQFRNFQFLQTTPEIMRLEVEAKEKDLEAALAKIEAQEKSVADQLGLTKVRETGQEVGEEREELMAQLEEIEQAYLEIASAREELENDRGEFYQEAVKRLKVFLEKQPMAQLKNQAAAQPGQTDDMIVDQINNIERSIEDLRKEGQSIEQRRSLSENQLEGLGRICAKYRRKDFDSARSFFDRGFSVRNYIESFLNGSLTEANFWSGLVQNQKFSRPARRYNPVYEHLSRGGGDVAGVFGRALGEMILSGELGGRRRGGLFGSMPPRSRGPVRRRSFPSRRGGGGLGGGGGFSSGSGF